MQGCGGVGSNPSRVSLVPVVAPTVDSAIEPKY